MLVGVSTLHSDNNNNNVISHRMFVNSYEFQKDNMNRNHFVN